MVSSTRHAGNFNPWKTPTQFPWDCPLSRRHTGSKTELSVSIMSPGINISTGSQSHDVRPTAIRQMDNTWVEQCFQYRVYLRHRVIDHRLRALANQQYMLHTWGLSCVAFSCRFEPLPTCWVTLVAQLVELLVVVTRTWDAGVRLTSRAPQFSHPCPSQFPRWIIRLGLFECWDFREPIHPLVCIQ